MKNRTGQSMATQAFQTGIQAVPGRHDVFRIVVQGRISYQEAPEFREIILGEVASTSGMGLVIDLGKVDRIDAAGLAVLVEGLLALIISLPCFVLFSDFVGIFGGLMVAVGVRSKGVHAEYLRCPGLEDLTMGLVKAFVFAMIIALVSCQQGLKTEGGAEQVGQATTASVVHSIVLIIAADLFVTAIFYLKG